MKTNPTSDPEPPRALPSKLRFAQSLNFWLFLFWTISTGSQAYDHDLNLQKPLTRLNLFLGTMAAVLFLILTIQERLEQRIATLLGRLEQKGLLSAEEHAAIGIAASLPVGPVNAQRVVRLLVIIIGLATILVVLGYLFAT